MLGIPFFIPNYVITLLYTVSSYSVLRIHKYRSRVSQILFLPVPSNVRSVEDEIDTLRTSCLCFANLIYLIFPLLFSRYETNNAKNF
jgi:hypothetical protein